MPPQKFLKVVDAYRDLEGVRHKYDDLQQEKDNLDIDNAGLRSKVKLLEGQLKVMETVEVEKRDLREKIVELKEKIGEFEKVEIEKKSLEQNLNMLKPMLTERVHSCCCHSLISPNRSSQS